MAEENQVMKEPQQVTTEPQSKAAQPPSGAASATGNYKEPKESCIWARGWLRAIVRGEKRRNKRNWRGQ